MLADHHALFLDIIALGIRGMPTRRKCNVCSLSEAEWNESNSQIQQDQSYKAIEPETAQDRNVQNVYRQFAAMLKGTFKDRHQKARSTDDWEAEEQFERLHAQHELHPAYQQAKEEHTELQRIHLVNEKKRLREPR